jgi:predicted dehydrogenase
MRYVVLMTLTAFGLALAARAEEGKKVRLMTLDPGHFHAALVQKFMYDDVDPVVYVYGPEGPDIADHLGRIEGFNARTDKPTAWKEEVYRGSDFLERLLSDKPGNVAVISGNNARKASYILACVSAGLNVLADKPMAITPQDFDALKQAFRMAAKNKVLLYDIMTERYEITTILQRELSRVPEVFGALDAGTPERPAVTKESVHHFFKFVSGKPLKRPPWFFDVAQQGEGIVDVTTHLVDLIQWECFPEQILDGARDVKVLSARRWPTSITPAQFKQATQMDRFPDYLAKDVDAEGNLKVFANGEFTYTLKGIHAKVSVAWNFEAPEGAGDTHFSMMRGTKANLVIRQGAEQKYKPKLYVEKVGERPDADMEKALATAVEKLQAAYPGIAVKPAAAGGWEIAIPESYSVGHEAHFAQVTGKYLGYLRDGKLPDWEVPDMIAKYYTIMKAYELSR